MNIAKKRRNIWIVPLAIIMILGMMPGITYAEETTETQQTSVEQNDGQVETNVNADEQIDTQIDADEQENADVQTDNGNDVQDGIDQQAEVNAQAEMQPMATGSLIDYRGHQQTYGNLEVVSDGSTMGVVGESKRLEAVTVSKGAALSNVSGDIHYRVHVQTYGTQGWKTTGQLAGTTGQAKRLEAIQMYLSGELASRYDIYYRVHIQTFGWMDWVKGGMSESDSKWAGSSGMSKRLEAVQITLVAKDGEKPAVNPTNSTAQSYVTATNFGDVMYSGHQQTYGNLAAVADGAVLGVTGQSKRIEAITITKGGNTTGLSGDIFYQVHGQTYGNQNWMQSGQQAGITGQSKRLEAIRMSLSGELDAKYDIYYRVHAQSLGWMAWTKGGSGVKDEQAAWAGTCDFAKRVEGIQIVLVPEGQQPAKGNPADQIALSYLTPDTIGSLSYAGVQEGVALPAVSSGTELGVTGESKKLTALQVALTGNAGVVIPGNITYRTYMQKDGWNERVSNGQMAGDASSAKRMEAIEISLDGTISSFCDVWYRVHVQHYGWLGWAKNGQAAGTDHMSYRIEAIEIQLVSKSGKAPGPNSDYYHTGLRTVYIDAGHGGSDSGATHNGRLEKNDTLRLALAVQAKLQAKGVNVVMARTDDDPGYTGVSCLYKRVEAANAAKANYYVSIHRDSAGASARGFTIYTHNANNDNVPGRQNANELPNKDADCIRLSNNIASQLQGVGTMNFRGIVYGSAGDDRSIDLIVNKYSNMPSCLIEMGFISNDADNSAFDRYLDQHAEAIANGIIATM